MGIMTWMEQQPSRWFTNTCGSIPPRWTITYLTVTTKAMASLTKGSIMPPREASPSSFHSIAASRRSRRSSTQNKRGSTSSSATITCPMMSCPTRWPCSTPSGPTPSIPMSTCRDAVSASSSCKHSPSVIIFPSPTWKSSWS